MACCILLGLFVTWEFTQAANQFCPPIYDGPAKRGEITQQPQGGGNQTQSPPGNRRPPVNQQQPAPQTDQTQSAEYRDWRTKFVCEATATDYAIAFFTYCLVIVGIFGMWSAERLTRDSERAHLFPDMAAGLAGGHVQVTVTPRNCGRSAGIQREVFGDFSLKKPWGILPFTGGSVIPTDQMVDSGERSIAHAGFSSRLIGPQFFFGYIGYMDLFHRRHKTYFCIRATPHANGVVLQWNDDDWRARWTNRFY